MHTLDHVALAVSDLDAAIAFYVEKLGLRLQFKEVDESHHEAFAFLELEGGNLELLQPLDEKNRPKPVAQTPVTEPYCPHVAIKTDDMDGLVGMLHEKDIPILKGPMEIPGSVRWIYFQDPDNNVLEYVQWL